MDGRINAHQVRQSFLSQHHTIPVPRPRVILRFASRSRVVHIVTHIYNMCGTSGSQSQNHDIRFIWLLLFPSMVCFTSCLFWEVPRAKAINAVFSRLDRGFSDLGVVMVVADVAAVGAVNAVNVVEVVIVFSGVPPDEPGNVLLPIIEATATLSQNAFTAFTDATPHSSSSSSP